MSSSTRNTVLGFVLLAAIAAGGWYAVTRGSRLPQSAPEVKGSAGSEETATPKARLENALALLPDQGHVVESEQISDHGFWIRQQFEEDTTLSDPIRKDKMWFVDTASNTVKLLDELPFDFSPSSMHDDSDDRYFHVRWSFEAFSDSTSTDRTEYIDRKTGEVVYLFENFDGQKLVLHHGEKTLTMELAPAERCLGMKEGASVKITGVEASGRFIPLSKPKSVNCGYDAFPSFRGFDFSADRKTVYVMLPWYEALAVPADSLDTKQTAFVDTTVVGDSWKTIRNEHLGFEMKYPVNWQISNLIEQSTGTAQILDKGMAYFGMFNQEYMDPNLMNLPISISESDLSLEEFVQQYEGRTENTGEGIKDLMKFADSLSADQAGFVTGAGWIHCTSFLLKVNDRYFDFGTYMNADSKEKMERRIEEYRNFLKTFKVL